MCSCRLCLTWTFDSSRFGVSVTKGWISFNMKARFFFLSFLFFFAACNPTERDDDGRSKVKRKSYRGRRGRRGGGRERIKKENSYWAQRRSLRGEAGFAHFIWTCSCSFEKLLRAAERCCELWEVGEEKKKSMVRLRQVLCGNSYLTGGGRGGLRSWQIQGTVCHCDFSKCVCV